MYTNNVVFFQKNIFNDEYVRFIAGKEISAIDRSWNHSSLSFKFKLLIYLTNIFTENNAFA